MMPPCLKTFLSMDTALYMVGYRYLPIYNIQCILALVITISIEAYLSLQCPPVCFRSPPPTSRFSVDMLATNGTRVKAVRKVTATSAKTVALRRRRCGQPIRKADTARASYYANTTGSRLPSGKPFTIATARGGRGGKACTVTREGYRTARRVWSNQIAHSHLTIDKKRNRAEGTFKCGAE